MNTIELLGEKWKKIPRSFEWRHGQKQRSLKLLGFTPSSRRKLLGKIFKHQNSLLLQANSNKWQEISNIDSDCYQLHWKSRPENVKQWWFSIIVFGIYYNKITHYMRTSIVFNLVMIHYFIKLWIQPCDMSCFLKLDMFFVIRW